MTESLVVKNQLNNKYVKLSLEEPIWDHVFLVAPLIVVGTKEGSRYDLAPKHMATLIGDSNYFAFICTPNHATYRNIEKHKEFSVSFPVPDQVVLASLSASPRCRQQIDKKPIVAELPTSKCKAIDARVLSDSYLYFECSLSNIIDGFDAYSIVVGRIVEAHVDSAYMKISDKDEQQQIYQNPLLAYIAHGRFAKITDSYNFPLPKGFKR